LITEEFADATKRTDIAIGTPEGADVYKFVSVALFLLFLLLLLRGQPNRDRQRSEQGYRGQKRQYPGLHHVASLWLALFRGLKLASGLIFGLGIVRPLRLLAEYPFVVGQFCSRMGRVINELALISRRFAGDRVDG